MINFYKNSSDRRALDKEIQILFSMNGTFNEDVDILHPSFIVSNAVNYADANYVWIEEFNRYYYIDKTIMRTGSIIEFQCSCDVLMSWKEQIKNLNAKIVRNENKGFTQLTDSEVKFTSESDVDVFRFPNQFDSANIGKAGIVNYTVTIVGG